MLRMQLSWISKKLNTVFLFRSLTAMSFSASQRSSSKNGLCRFHGSALGYYFHNDPQSVPFCQNLLRYNACVYGDKCHFRHQHYNYPQQSYNQNATINTNGTHETFVYQSNSSYTLQNINQKGIKHYQGWTPHANHSQVLEQGQLVRINPLTMWYFQQQSYGSFMIEYCVETDTIKNSIPFPSNISSFLPQCFCSFNSMIYIMFWDPAISAQNYKIVSFNPSTKKFKIEKELQIGDVGSLRCVALHDAINIFGAFYSKIRAVYYPKTNTIKVKQDGFSASVLFSHKDRLMCFGKNTQIPQDPVDRFIKSSIVKRDCDDIEWIEQSGCGSLESLYKVSRFGFIVYENVLITFGGIREKNITNYTDSIYALDLSDANNKWGPLKAKCPEPNTYEAVFFDNKNRDNLLIHGYCGRIPADLMTLIKMFTPGSGEVHLMSTGNVKVKAGCHYSISLASLLQHDQHILEAMKM